MQQQEGDASSVWRCSSCSKEFEAPVETYLLQLTLVDETGSLKVSLIGEKAEVILKELHAAELRCMQQQQTLDRQGRSFNDVFADASLTVNPKP